MGKLLVATNNPAKFNEFRTFLEPHGIALVSLKDLHIADAFDEDAETFAENSLLKANFYWQRSHLPTLADDDGLEIDALQGGPGVHSRRIDGQWRSDEEAVRLILEKVKDVPESQRTARMKIVVTLRVAQDRNFQAEATTHGIIRQSTLAWEPGFPYRTILWIPKYEKFLQELTPDEQAAINHRKRAIEQLLPYITQYV